MPRILNVTYSLPGGRDRDVGFFVIIRGILYFTKDLQDLLTTQRHHSPEHSSIAYKYLECVSPFPKLLIASTISLVS